MIGLRAKGQGLREIQTKQISVWGFPLAFSLQPLALSLGIFGTIENPLGTAFGEAGQYASVETGFGLLLTNIVRLITIAAGLWSFANMLVAGFIYITANAEAEKLVMAWAKIWQSLIGLIIIVGAFALTGIISKLLFGDPMTIINPVIYGPGKATL